ncbi:LOW QUALITY PROTEIN: Integrase catalytic core protein [Phytophthora palmivora]|uniref:Integrase catalytic core protein n=1 Tax=Phytophthora palmivora TaxID=4796 RepID=A0A2P4XBD3_9STRA|nr:LOW QUALITY PROTEIN: Integrase catalytic core protein [Phytophthora palmivora]
MAKTSEAGFLLGYLEDHIGCKVYFPQHHVSRVVCTIRVHEDILYRDRHAIPTSLMEPLDMDIESIALGDEETYKNQERALLDQMRSLSERPTRSSKRGMTEQLIRNNKRGCESVVGRREGKRQRYEPCERKRPTYLEFYRVYATLHPSLPGRKWTPNERGVLATIDEVPEGEHDIDTKWVYDVKVDESGYVTRFGARIVAKGLKQVPGLDLVDTFSPVARLSTFRLLVALARNLKWKMWQSDVDNAYLKVKLEINNTSGTLKVLPMECIGLINLYMKQGREWNEELDGWKKDVGFKQCKTDPCLYFYAKNGDVALVLIYVDDVVCTSNSEQFKCKLISAQDKKYGFKDMGFLTNYLDIRVRQTNKETILDQEQYARNILKSFDLEVGYSNKCGIPMETNTKLKKWELIGGRQWNHETGKVPYREAVECLMYRASETRSDLTVVVGQLDRFAEHPTEQHVGVLKRVMRYLLGTVTKGITYDTRMTCDIGVHLEGHSDSDWANDLDTRKSTTGYVFSLMGASSGLHGDKLLLRNLLRKQNTLLPVKLPWRGKH